MLTKEEIVKALLGEQELVCFDPLSGKMCDPNYLTDMNRKSYILYGDAADLIEQQSKKIEQLMSERDAAIADLYRVKSCKTCAKQYKDDCLLEECMDPCSTFAEGNLPYEWRGFGDNDER